MCGGGGVGGGGHMEVAFNVSIDIIHPACVSNPALFHLPPPPAVVKSVIRLFRLLCTKFF